MARKVLTIALVASLLACALLVALWIRNVRRSDVVAWSGGETVYTVNAENGVIRFLVIRGDPPPWRWIRTSYATPGRDQGLWVELRSHGDALAPVGIDFRTEFPYRKPGTTVHAVYLPHWLLILLTGVPAGLWARREWRRALIGRRKRLGQCVCCGYDLRATSDRCPECGVVLTSTP